MFWKHLTVLPITLLLREVKQSQIDRLTSRHVCQNMSPILKTLELSGKSSFPGWGVGSTGGCENPIYLHVLYQANSEEQSSINKRDRYDSS